MLWIKLNKKVNKTTDWPLRVLFRMFHPPFFLQCGMWCKFLIYCSSIAMYLKPKWILQIYRMQHVLTMTEHTLTLGYFHVSLFLRDSLSLSFMSLNKTDINFNCFKSFYENVSLDSLLLKYGRHPGPSKYYWPINILHDVVFIIIKLTCYTWLPN